MFGRYGGGVKSKVVVATPCGILGLTISADVTKDMMKASAALATYKYACLGIDMNGSHGGIKICKSDYSEQELKSIVQKYTFELIKRASFGKYHILFIQTFLFPRLKRVMQARHHVLVI